MKKITYIFLTVILLTTTVGCEKLVEGINDNPNEISSDNFDAGILLLKGVELANVSVQLGHMARIGGMWSGQTIGVSLLYRSIYQYNLSAEETDGVWQNAYQGVVKQARTIREQTAAQPNAKQISGITKILEANTVGTIASLFGDVPYTEVSNPAILTPKFDSQKAVFSQVQTLLDEAIADLTGATSGAIPEDLYLNGNVARWLKAAHTLKARYFMVTREYDKANASALLGISTAAESVYFTPPNIGNGSLNLNYKMVNERAGYWGFDGSHLDTILKGAKNNDKTDEKARLAYYRIDGNTANNNKGIAAAGQRMPIASYEETLLHLAESHARLNRSTEALTSLNRLRTYLASGSAFTKLNAADVLKYDAYITADFETGGLMNTAGLTPTRAMLREIVMERYVTGFTTQMPFDDLRRLTKSDTDIAVKPPFNSPTVSQYPQRFIVAQTELGTNPNAPQDPGIFAATEVNR
jgi:hypothetical protein